MAGWLLDGFLASARRLPGRPALSLGEEELSYSDLEARAMDIATALAERPRGGRRLTGVLATRSVGAYAGVLGALFNGDGYLPLNPKFPVARLGYMIAHAGITRLVTDASAASVLDAVLDQAAAGLVVVVADRNDVRDLAGRHPRHRVLPGRGRAAGFSAPTPPADNAMAYLLYTSGSTGQPKGVMVSHANVAHFLDCCENRYQLCETDRFSQMFDLGFDLSVFDLFVAWKSGGCVCCPGPGELMLPADYIRRSGITVWFSVPSVAVLMNRLRQMEPGAFPQLKLSLFCGEALPGEAAAAWAAAAPNSIVENLYGPTEVTLACMAHRWTAADAGKAIVPIGSPFAGMNARVVSADRTPVGPGEVGELMMSGPQVALGYLDDKAKTDAAFIVDPATGGRWYRTGDLVRLPDDVSEPFEYLGRLDHQIKLHGHRIELGEIEVALKEASGAAQALVVPWPVNGKTVAGLAAFLECDAIDEKSVLHRLRQRLPDYMIPKAIHAVPSFPLTSNLKVDRKQLMAQFSTT